MSTASRQGSGMTEEAPGAAAVGIFALLLSLHVVLKLYARIAPSDGLTPQERLLLKEIKDLNRSANELSTPATFAKSAKLKRQVAVKEKELAELRQELSLRKRWRLPSSTIVGLAVKAVVHILLVLWFWRTSVATVPVALLKPSGGTVIRSYFLDADYFVSIGKKDVSGDLLRVGIIPWLVMSSRVSAFLSEKVVGKPPQRATPRRVSFLQNS